MDFEILTHLGICRAFRRCISTVLCTGHRPPRQGVDLDAGALSWNPGLHQTYAQSRSTAVLGRLVWKGAAGHMPGIFVVQICLINAYMAHNCMPSQAPWRGTWGRPPVYVEARSCCQHPWQMAACEYTL